MNLLPLMTALGTSDVATIDATTNVESGDDEEISNEDVPLLKNHVCEAGVIIEGCSSKSLNCVERKMSSLNKSVLKNEKEKSLNELEIIKKTMWMMNSSTMTLDKILLMGRTTKDHKGLGFMEERS